MKVNRRTFLGGLVATGAMPLFGGESSRIARIGVMTDTHVLGTLESCSRVKAALELFKRLGAEMVVNCGDIADRHSAKAYQGYRETFNAVYPDATRRPKEVYVYAGHDVVGFRERKGWNLSGDYAPAYAALKRHLEIPNETACDFIWKGLPFAVFPQGIGDPGLITWADYEATVSRLCRENPGKPVFVFEHVPAAGTTFHTRHWGFDESRKILNKYPQVVHISGHVHGSVKSERQIWQGEFTEINAGCLQTWGGFAPGSTPPRQAKPNFGVLVIDVYADGLKVFRYDVRDGRECAAPWFVPFPFVAKAAPYRPEIHALTQSLPNFADGSAVTVVADGDGYRIEFPEARAGADPFMYRLAAQRKVADGSWQTFTRDDIFGDFWKADKDRTGKMSYRLNAAFFTAGETYRLTVTPLDFFYREGRSAACSFKATHAPKSSVWAWDGSPDALVFNETVDGSIVRPTIGGRFVPASGFGRLHVKIPEASLKALKPGTEHQMVIDLDLVQPDGGWCAWLLVLAVEDGPGIAHVQTAPGAPGVLRYVFSFKVPDSITKGLVLCFNYKAPGASVRVVGAELF